MDFDVKMLYFEKRTEIIALKPNVLFATTTVLYLQISALASSFKDMGSDPELFTHTGINVRPF
jgi:hypothetical protein